jgi:shikimate kinase
MANGEAAVEKRFEGHDREIGHLRKRVEKVEECVGDMREDVTTTKVNTEWLIKSDRLKTGIGVSVVTAVIIAVVIAVLKYVPLGG